ncbi:MAG: sulfatase-like hydrolase/transferase [Opitutaceae bacterium]|jgi:arylsulfatase A-like enzyme|nr:sulfatase-like hydrolase/transferase [Opitutaceae bacterium]
MSTANTVSAALPDILWIVTTQWRAQACGYAGDPNARTPCLDALASCSINYTQAVTPHPFGPFARAALLTGVPSPANGVRDYHDPLPTDARTIAHRMAGLGYETAFFGKWHLAPRDPRAALVGEAHARQFVPPEHRGGFVFWEGFEGGFLLNDPWLHGTRLPEPVHMRGYQSDVVCERAAAWWHGLFPPIAHGRRSAPPDRSGAGVSPASIASPFRRGTGFQPVGVASPLRRGAGVSPASGVARAFSVNRPFFCVVSLEPPHPPYAAPVPMPVPMPVPTDLASTTTSPSYPAAPSDLILPSNVPRGGDTETQARRELAGYYAHIAATDRAIGRLVAAVDAAAAGQGRAAPVIVFTSAHGDMHGAHGLFRKGWPYEESVRVPLLVRPSRPAAAPAPVAAVPPPPPPLPPATSDEPVSLLDLPAMTLALAKGSTGSTAKPWRCGRDRAEISMPSVVALTHQCDRVWRGWRSPERKEIVNADGSPWLCFDLTTDPGETSPLP